MLFFRFKTILFLLLFICFTNISAKTTPEKATSIFNVIAKTVQKDISSRNLQINFQINDKPKPGAFSKWQKAKKIGTISITNTLLEIVDERVLSVFICHEFGHFLGGIPYVKSKPSTGIHTFRNKYPLMSAEGQADYYASNKCLIPLFKHMSWTSETPRNEFLINCKETSFDQNVCNEVLDSIYTATKTYSQILETHYNVIEDFDSLEISLLKPQETIALPGEYPELQCRFDTMIAGLENKQRPSCWYNAD